MDINLVTGYTLRGGGATRSVYGLLGLPGLGSRQRQKASTFALEKTPAVSLAVKWHGSEAHHSPLSSVPVKEAGAAFPLRTRILMTRYLGNSEYIQGVYPHLIAFSGSKEQRHGSTIDKYQLCTSYEALPHTAFKNFRSFWSKYSHQPRVMFFRSCQTANFTSIQNCKYNHSFACFNV
jgi:hypothetical protein